MRTDDVLVDDFDGRRVPPDRQRVSALCLCAWVIPRILRVGQIQRWHGCGGRIGAHGDGRCPCAKASLLARVFSYDRGWIPGGYAACLPASQAVPGYSTLGGAIGARGYS